MVVSSEPEIIIVPSGEKFTEITSFAWPCIAGRTTAPEVASQARMVLSEDPETIVLLSGENTTEYTGPKCPEIAGRVSAPVVASQTRTVASNVPETIRRPSGENLTDKTKQPCPHMTGTSVASVPDIKSQIRESPFPEHATIRRPSGERFIVAQLFVRISLISVPVVDFQTCMIPLLELETMRVPSEEMANECTQPCAVSFKSSGGQDFWKPPDIEGYISGRWNVRYRRVLVGVNGNAYIYTRRGCASIDCTKIWAKRHASRISFRSLVSSGK